MTPSPFPWCTQTTPVDVPAVNVTSNNAPTFNISEFGKKLSQTKRTLIFRLINFKKLDASVTVMHIKPTYLEARMHFTNMELCDMQRFANEGMHKLPSCGVSVTWPIILNKGVLTVGGCWAF